MEPRINFVTLGVADLARSRTFYETGLGWTVVKEQGDIVFFQLGRLFLGLYPRPLLAEDATVPDDERLTFRGITLSHNVRSRDEADAALTTAARAGAEIVKPAQQVFWGGYSGYFADPDFHLWEVCYNPFADFAADGSLIFRDD